MKKLFLFTVLSVIVFTGFPQTSVWKVTGKGTTLYLGGTIHLLRSSDFPLPAQFDSAYARSSAIVLETNMDELQKPEIAQKMMLKMMFTDDKTLQSVLSDTAFKVLTELCTGVGLPITNLAKFKPPMVILMATMMKLQQMGFSSDGVDKAFFTKAKEQGKQLMFLETIDQQIEYLTNLGIGNENELVLQSITDLKKSEKDFPELVSAWRNGNDAIMTKNAEAMKKDYPSMYKSLLVDRNKNWMPVIESYLATPETEFILVGSMHLYTPDGVVKMLRDKGYNVEQL